MNKRKTIRNTLLFSLISVILTSCIPDSELNHITGEWQYEDSIYIKCTGSDDDYQRPIGWIKLNDKIYEFDAYIQANSYFGLNYDKGTVDVDYNWDYSFNSFIMYTYLNLTRSGQIKFKVYCDFTETYKKNDILYLDRIDA